MGEPLIETRGLSKRFGGVQAVGDVDFALEHGELRSIVGPNGAGKSTFFKMLLGSVRPDSGMVFFEGRDVTRLGAHRRSRLGVGVKFQNHSVYDRLTVRHNLLLPMRHRHRGTRLKQEVEALLGRLNLEGCGAMPAGHLSHGQKQWLAIGMALAMRPKLLLLDEPCAGLGPGETAATATLLQRVSASDGIAAIVVEHDMAFVRKLAAPVTVLHYGRVFAEGSLEEIEQHEEVRHIYLGSAELKRLRRSTPQAEARGD